jgi:AcrR family transcriptional regulator
MDQEQTPTLSRDIVLAHALEIVNLEGVESLTFRRLAEALDVTPMAIYRHVENKRDLLNGTLDLVMRKARVVDHDEPEWRDWVCETFVRMRSALLEQRGALVLVLRWTTLGPHALAVIEEILARLTAAGFARAAATQLFHRLIIHTLGSAALFGAILSQAPELTDQDERLRRVRAMFELLPGREFPHVTSHASELAEMFREERFVAEIRQITEDQSSFDVQGRRRPRV